MGLSDAIDRLERRLSDDAAAWNEQNADILREEAAERDAEQDLELAVLPVFNRYTDRLSHLGLSVEWPHSLAIQLAVKDRTHSKHSLYYRLVEDRRVMVARLVMDGNGDVVANLPLAELTNEQVATQVEQFVDWYLSRVDG